MILFLIRHGDAEAGAQPDPERCLTPEGREAIVRLARKITGLAEAPSLLLSSPFTRAIQTAEAFRDGWDIPLQIVDWLVPQAEPSKVLSELGRRPEQSVALVGHLPCLGLLLGTLVWGLPPKEVVLPKGGAACLSLSRWEAGSAKLKWLLSPETSGS
jgi:phosphohistidine phosphatase